MKALVTATSLFQPVNARGKALAGKTLGIVGPGAIGRRLAVRAMGVDAFEEEPLGDSPLKGLDRVIFPPISAHRRIRPLRIWA